MSLSAKEIDEQTCACGCKLPHNLAVSRVVTEDMGGYRTRRVVWYRSMAHRNVHQAGE